MEQLNISLRKIIDEFLLEDIYLPKNPEKIFITDTDVTRPGLQLAGFYEYFIPDRIQIIGNAEHHYLSKLSDNIRGKSLDKFFSQHPVAIVIARDLPIFPEYTELAAKYDVPVLRTSDGTSGFISALIANLSLNLAPRIERSGELLEVFGEGVMVTGESGIGKSEVSLELIKRGHRLIADDVINIKKVSEKSLVGFPPENMKHFIELRGIGIVNVLRLFGTGAIKDSAKIELIVELKKWEDSVPYERLGIDREFTSIMDIKIPSMTVPVKVGRNLALIIEIAAMNNRQKKMGHNAGMEYLNSLGMDFDVQETVKYIN
ncbi:MAG: HPr(Ser) kinase/phosphatase [Ruminococcus sp.]|jgi:HPr kinase/phosphorylase|nr:HPr(Ser) kinase/phosphatase [Ruminococcus sp.]